MVNLSFRYLIFLGASVDSRSREKALCDIGGSSCAGHWLTFASFTCQTISLKTLGDIVRYQIKSKTDTKYLKPKECPV